MTNQAENGLLYRKQAQLFVTDICDLGCFGCPYPKIRREQKAKLLSQQITPSQWGPITDHLYAQGVREFCIIGGEPGSYENVDQVISNIALHKDALVLFSTSGIHLLNNEDLRTKVGTALASTPDRKIRNGYVISFDALPKGKTYGSRDEKARKGIESIRLLQQQLGDRIIYAANVMVNPENLYDVLNIQKYLEDRDISTNLCTQQTRCFGEKPVFDETHKEQLTEIALEMIRRKIEGRAVVNSITYLSQLPEKNTKEQYKCWEEENGSPILDIGPSGFVRFCNWIGTNQQGGSPGVNIIKLISGEVSWTEFWELSKQTTKNYCPGCSWSRRDRNPVPMYSPNQEILARREFQGIDPSAPNLQNIWAQAQM